MTMINNNETITEILVTKRKSGTPISNITSILEKGRDTPELIIVQEEIYKNKKRKRYFKKNIYSDFKWITGNAKNNTLHCFYCLIFSKKNSRWSKSGYNDLKNLKLQP